MLLVFKICVEEVACEDQHIGKRRRLDEPLINALMVCCPKSTPN